MNVKMYMVCENYVKLSSKNFVIRVCEIIYEVVLRYSEGRRCGMHERLYRNQTYEPFANVIFFEI